MTDGPVVIWPDTSTKITISADEINPVSGSGLRLLL